MALEDLAASVEDTAAKTVLQSGQTQVAGDGHWTGDLGAVLIEAFQVQNEVAW